MAMHMQHLTSISSAVKMGAWSETVISSQSPECDSPVSPHGPGGERHSTRSHHEGTRAFSLSYSRRGAAAALSSPTRAPPAVGVLAACSRSGDRRRFAGLVGSGAPCESRSGLSSSVEASEVAASLLSLAGHALSLPALPLPRSSLSRVHECRLGSSERLRCIVAEVCCAMRSSRLCAPDCCRTYLYEGGKESSASAKP